MINNQRRILFKCFVFLFLFWHTCFICQSKVNNPEKHRVHKTKKIPKKHPQHQHYTRLYTTLPKQTQIIFCRSLFVSLSFFFWLLLFCLPFFNLQLLITTLVGIFRQTFLTRCSINLHTKITLCINKTNETCMSK
jgi:hypothetical protein